MNEVIPRIDETYNAHLPHLGVGVTLDIGGGEQDPARICALAERLLSGAANQNNRRQALTLYERAANLDFPLSHFRLGEIYRQGQHGFRQNIHQAAHHYRRAAELGHIGAMVQLYRALPIKNTFEEALWLQRARFLNSADATTDFQTAYPSAAAIDALADRLFEEGQKLLSDGVCRYQKAGEAGHGPSYEKLGNFYSSGYILPSNGETQTQAALEHYHKAVSKNRLPPIVAFTDHLATPKDCHLHGDRLYTTYPAAAFACYQKADDFEGYVKMAAMYANGHGATRDTQKAFEYYERAYSKQATSSFATRICALSEDTVILEQFGDRSADPKVKFACYQKSNCRKKLGDCYAHGIDIAVDRQKAFEQYNRANLDTNILFELIKSLRPSREEYVLWGDLCSDRACGFRCYTEAKALLKIAEAHKRGDGVLQDPWNAFTAYLRFELELRTELQQNPAEARRFLVPTDDQVALARIGLVPGSLELARDAIAEYILALTNDKELLWRMGSHIEAQRPSEWHVIADACFKKGNWGSHLLELSQRTDRPFAERSLRYLQAAKCGNSSVDVRYHLIYSANVSCLKNFKSLAESDRFRNIDIINVCNCRIAELQRPPSPRKHGFWHRATHSCEIS